MRTSATLLNSLTDSIPAPLSGLRARETLDGPLLAQPSVVHTGAVHPKSALMCHCCGGIENVTADQYGETLCSECQERASGDTWFDTGGG
jgi:hypothetical protein